MKKLLLISLIFVFTGEVYTQDVSNRIRRITQRSYSRVPIGSIIAFAGTESSFNELNRRILDNSFMICKGQELNRQSYPALHYVIRTVWGGGSTGSKFSIPDLQGRFLRGSDIEGKLDPDTVARKNNDGEDRRGVGGYQTFATAKPKSAADITQDIGNHSHTVGIGATDKDAGSQLEVDKQRFADFQASSNGAKNTSESGGHHHSISWGDDKETRPVNAAVLYIIRVK